MANQPGGDCRRTWLVDPGIGQLIGRAQLLQAADLYNHHGFERQWLWYSPIQTVAVDSLGQRWVSCHEETKVGAICAPNQVDFTPNSVIDNFGQRPLLLSAFAYGGRVIPRVCGNFFTPHDTHLVPVPRATIEKFDDRNRNGQRDGGEGGLGGWQFRVVRIASQFGDQPNDLAAVVTTGGDGLAELRFDGLGPGTYRIEEVGQDGWAATTPAVQTLVVQDGIGDAHVGHLRFGNAQTRADLVKVQFALSDPPQRLEAGQTHELTVRAHIRNDGPADVTARDTVDVAAPADCVVEPAHSEATRALPSGTSAVIEFGFRIRCEDPSFHPLTFTDHLYVHTGGVTDPDPSDNTVAFEHLLPVFDRADIGLSGTAVTCPARSDVNEEFVCTVSATVSNAGPYGPVGTDIAFALTPPGDCSATDIGASAVQSVSLEAGQPLRLTSAWRVNCAQRSFHPVNATASATLNHLHVEDPEPGNGTGSAGTQIEIFEPADLQVSSLDIRCTEREANTLASACTATAVVANNGPATGVAAMAALTLTPEPTCTAAPANTQERSITIQSGQSTTIVATWQLTCSTAARHAARVRAAIRTDEPHAEDRDLDNNTMDAVWGPVDVKPRSLPSSINIGKNGLVPFSVLSTATLDALSDVDRASLRFGRTGTEQSVVSCAPTGEDVNDDGRLDLICRAETQLLGLTCDTTVLRLTGRTADGVLFFGEDTVKVVGC